MIGLTRAQDSAGRKGVAHMRKNRSLLLLRRPLAAALASLLVMIAFGPDRATPIMIISGKRLLSLIVIALVMPYLAIATLLYQQHRSMTEATQRGDINALWYFLQLNVEYERFDHALHQHLLAADNLAMDDLQLRYDLLLSRFSTIESGTPRSLMQSLINAILDLSKIEAGKLEVELIDFELQRVLDDVALLLEEKCTAKGLRLALERWACEASRSHCRRA
jgi:signal transduction histidine kinase